MCGRYATTRSSADLTALFDALDQTGEGELGPRYNVAPTDPVPAVMLGTGRLTAGSAPLRPLAAGLRPDRGPEGGQRVLATARWGLLPHWAKDPRDGARMINARAETVATSPAYAPAFANRRKAGGRALLPADGWYEWRRLPGGGKQPYFLTPADGSVLAMAGLWSRWGSERLLTVTVVTTAAGTDELAGIHDRMPLLLPPDRWGSWLSGDPALDPPPQSCLARLELRPVGPAVGNVRNDGPELVTRVDLERPAEAAAPGLFSLDQLATRGANSPVHGGS